MTTKISSSNIQQSTLETIGGGPKITAVTVTNSSYAPSGAGTVSTAGGYIQITGTGFVTGIQVAFNKTPASAVGFVSSQTLNVQVPALVAGTYNIYIINTNGSFGLKPAGLTVSA